MFTKEMLVDKITLEATFDKLYKDKEGKPITFIFPFMIETGEIADRLSQFSLTPGRKERDQALERFCLLLVDEPKPFADFPKGEKSLYERAKAYFDDPLMDVIVSQALGLYNRVVSPQELFRRL